MNKFNLEKALAGDKVITRDGKEVIHVHKFNVSGKFMPIIGIVDGGYGYWHLNGKQNKDCGSYKDLFMAPELTEEEKAIHHACLIVEDSIRCTEANINIDCSVAIKAVIITMIKNGYRKGEA